MLNNIVDNLEQCGQQNIVQCCFHQARTGCAFFAVYWGLRYKAGSLAARLDGVSKLWYGVTVNHSFHRQRGVGEGGGGDWRGSALTFTTAAFS